MTYDFSAQQKRIDWIYQQFGADGCPNLENFIDNVNCSYYRASASLYGSRYVADIARQYGRIFSTLGLQRCQGLTVVDVGGGSGFEYGIFHDSAIAYERFLFVEPDTEMGAAFLACAPPDDNALEFVHGTFGTVAPQIKETRNKVIVINSVFHHLIDIKEFLDTLKSAMLDGDLFFLCHEPDNRYAGTGFMWFGRLLKALVTIAGLRRLGIIGRQSIAADRQRWQTINEDLLQRDIIRSPMRPIVIRRIIDYGVNNMGDASRLGVPAEYNEGYWTVQDIEDYLGGDYSREYYASYRHFGDPQSNIILVGLNRLCEGMFRDGGADFCAVFRKND